MRFIPVLVAFTAILFGSSSCKKDPDTIVKIYVYSDSEPVSGATVQLVPEGGMDKERIAIKTATTNSSGVATFDLTDEYKPGQAGVAVLDIDVNDGQAKGIIKVEEKTTSEETVFL